MLLTLIRKDNKKIFTFNKIGEFICGRGDSCDIPIPEDSGISRNHFAIIITDKKCKVRDLNSKNGTFVNNVRYGGRKAPQKDMQLAPAGIVETALADKDILVVGETIFNVSLLSSNECTRCGKVTTYHELSQYQVFDHGYFCIKCWQKHCKKTTIEEDYTPIEPASSSKVTGLKLSGLKIIEKLCDGGMGTIYKAIKLEDSREVVVKTLKPKIANNIINIKLFLREIEITRQLRHQNIVELIDFGRENNVLYLVLEYIDGIVLDEYLDEKGGKLDLEESLKIMVSLLEGMAYAHTANIVTELPDGTKPTYTGLVHRDIKPENIFLIKKGDEIICKVADFGLAKCFASASATDITTHGHVAGTPAYWPREHISHFKYLAPVTDVFSIGAIFYELLTGEYLRDGLRELYESDEKVKLTEYIKTIKKNPVIPVLERDPNIPKPIADIIEKSLIEIPPVSNYQKMREKLEEIRFPNAQVFLENVLDACKEVGITLT